MLSDGTLARAAVPSGASTGKLFLFFSHFVVFMLCFDFIKKICFDLSDKFS